MKMCGVQSLKKRKRGVFVIFLKAGVSKKPKTIVSTDGRYEFKNTQTLAKQQRQVKQSRAEPDILSLAQPLFGLEGR